MKTLNEIIQRPSGFDSLNNYAGQTDFPGLYVVLTRNRDSDCLGESNWRVALEQLGGESDDVIIHRFGHWACGWWEALCVSGDKQTEGEQIVNLLADYPILDEEDFSTLEHETAQKSWEDLSLKWRVELCQEHDVSVFAARHDYLPEDDCGGIVSALSE